MTSFNPGNWSSAFQSQVTAAVGRAPVFLINGNGASWTAWVTDNSSGPNMFSYSGLTQLTDFGALVKSWLASKAGSAWVQQ